MPGGGAAVMDAGGGSAGCVETSLANAIYLRFFSLRLAAFVAEPRVFRESCAARTELIHQ